MTKLEIQELYAQCLHLAGITDAGKLIPELIDEKNPKYFSHYVPVSSFTCFQDDFIYYSNRQIDLCKWKADKTKIQKPTRDIPIYQHYKEGFIPAFPVD